MLDGQPQLLETLLMLFRQVRQVLAKRLELLRLQMAQWGHLRSKCLRQSTYRQRLRLPIAARRAGRLLSSEGHLLPQFPFKPLESALQLAQTRVQPLPGQRRAQQQEEL